MTLLRDVGWVAQNILYLFLCDAVLGSMPDVALRFVVQIPPDAFDPGHGFGLLTNYTTHCAGCNSGSSIQYLTHILILPAVPGDELAEEANLPFRSGIAQHTRAAVRKAGLELHRAYAAECWQGA